MNVFKFSLSYNYMITQFELDVVGCYRDNVRILDGGEADEIIHRLFSDSKRWIAVGIVLAMSHLWMAMLKTASATQVMHHAVSPKK